jgi:hypothetical protein
MDVLMKRFLLSVFAFALSTSCFAADWVRQPAPLLPANQAPYNWEERAVYEPVYIPAGQGHDNKHRLFYVGGWNNSEIGVTTCDGDPRVPACWVKHPTPVIGPGAGNFHRAAAHHDLVYLNGLYHAYFSSVGPGSHIWHATSPDGINFTVNKIPAIVAQGAVQFGNSALLVDKGIIYNFLDYFGGGNDIWRTALARSSVSSPGIVTLDYGLQLTSLQINGSVYGGNAIVKGATKYHRWGINGWAPNENLPSCVAHHTSDDGIAWTFQAWLPCYTAAEFSQGYDQLADPSKPAEWTKPDGSKVTLIFYSMVINDKGTAATNGTAFIGLMTRDDPLSVVAP